MEQTTADERQVWVLAMLNLGMDWHRLFTARSLEHAKIRTFDHLMENSDIGTLALAEAQLQTEVAWMWHTRNITTPEDWAGMLAEANTEMILEQWPQ